MSKVATPGMDNQYSQKLMEAHQKNLDTFVNANKVVSDGYQAIATKQMEIFQEGLTKMASYSPEQAAEFTQNTYQESAQQMQELIEMATKAHQDAFNLLSARAKDLIDEAKG
ncbi:MAG: phasin family protein [Cellvibrionaceae bacterium]